MGIRNVHCFPNVACKIIGPDCLHRRATMGLKIASWIEHAIECLEDASDMGRRLAGLQPDRKPQTWLSRRNFLSTTQLPLNAKGLSCSLKAAKLMMGERKE